MPEGHSCRIGFFAMDRGAYQEHLWQDCLESARHHGFSARLYVADSDSQKQASQMRACLREPPDERPTVFFVGPVREVALVEIAHAATRSGIGVVLLGRRAGYIEELNAQFPQLPIFSVLANQLKIGRIQGRQLTALLPDGGEVVYIRGPLGTTSATGRFAGLSEVLQSSPIKLFTLNSDWTVEGGARAIREWAGIFGARDFPAFVVAAQNDSMAMGARGALEAMAQQRTRLSTAALAFCGSDGVPGYGQRLVKEGKLASTIIMPASAGRAIAEIAALRAGGPTPRPNIVLAPSPFPTPEVLRPLHLRAPPPAGPSRARSL
jgi:ribose transport system substrate-binding protein